MTRRVLARIALAAGLAASWPSIVPSAQVIPQKIPPAVAARRIELQKILDQYIAGDREIVSRSLQRTDSVTKSALRLLLGDKEADWHPGRAAFALEVAAVSPFFFDLDALTRYSREILSRRPSPIGADPAEDRFELLCHHLALALLQSLGEWPMHHIYLSAANPRLVKLESLYPKLSNRIPLMRATDAVMDCCAKLLASKAIPLVTVVTSRDPSSRSTPPPPTPEAAIALFEHAARNEALRPEALIRAAFLHERRGRTTEGLEALDRAGPPGDPIIEYAAALIRAGLLDRRGPPSAAAESYQAAVKLAPGAQVPAIGLAAALQRAGRIDEAVEAAQRARLKPVDGFDPWPDFLRMDARFAQSWLMQLRGLLK